MARPLRIKGAIGAILVYHWPTPRCSATIGTGKSVNQDWKEQSRQRMIDAARQESKGFLKPPRVNQDGVLIDA
jgi:hypothetical protein